MENKKKRTEHKNNTWKGSKRESENDTFLCATSQKGPGPQRSAGSRRVPSTLIFFSSQSNFGKKHPVALQECPFSS